MAEIPLIFSFAYYSNGVLPSRSAAVAAVPCRRLSNPASIRHVKVSLQAYPRTKNISKKNPPKKISLWKSVIREQRNNNNKTWPRVKISSSDELWKEFDENTFKTAKMAEHRGPFSRSTVALAKKKKKKTYEKARTCNALRA